MAREKPTPVKKIALMFRQHDLAPDDVVSPLYRQLTAEWADIHALDSTATTVRRWGRTQPALAGFHRPGDIVDAIDAFPNEAKNALLLALIRLFQAGHQLAGRTVLQALLPKLAKITAHVSVCTSSSDSSAEDRRHITLAEFWDVMAHYPVDRRATSVASNLALDTLHRVSGVRRPADDIPIDPHDFHVLKAAPGPWLTGLTVEDPTDTVGDELTADAHLAQVLAWGLRSLAITRDEAQLLATSYLTTSKFGFADAAEHLGLSQAAVRQRCSRAARKLTAAVRAEVLDGLPPMDLPAVHSVA